LPNEYLMMRMKPQAYAVWSYGASGRCPVVAGRLVQVPGLRRPAACHAVGRECASWAGSDGRGRGLRKITRLHANVPTPLSHSGPAPQSGL